MTPHPMKFEPQRTQRTQSFCLLFKLIAKGEELKSKFNNKLHE